MAAQFPGALPVFTGTTETSPATTTPSPFAAWATKVAEEIVAIATELGADVSGLESTVKARLDNFDASGITADYHGYLAWTSDPALSTVSAIPTTAGTMYTARLFTPVAITVTNVAMSVATGGGTLTASNNRVALYDSAGNLYSGSISADQTTAWGSSGIKVMALGAPQSVPAGYFDVGLWWNGTTGPTLHRIGNGNGA
jgi:hypothetical protein